MKDSVKKARAGLISACDADRAEAQAVKDDKTKVVAVQLDSSQLATILAALRSFQQRYEDLDSEQLAEAFPDHFEGVMPLGSEDIDTLCEEINCGPKPPHAQPRIIPTTFGNQKKRPKCYRCNRVIRDAEYMREGPMGEDKARHVNACPPSR